MRRNKNRLAAKEKKIQISWESVLSQQTHIRVYGKNPDHISFSNEIQNSLGIYIIRAEKTKRVTAAPRISFVLNCKTTKENAFKTKYCDGRGEIPYLLL